MARTREGKSAVALIEEIENKAPAQRDAALSAFLDLEDEIRTAHDLISIAAGLADRMGKYEHLDLGPGMGRVEIRKMIRMAYLALDHVANLEKNWDFTSDRLIGSDSSKAA